MTITIYPTVPENILLYQSEHFGAWKRVDREGNRLLPGSYKIASMGHIYGIPKSETIVSLISHPEHKGAQIAHTEYGETSGEQPLMESHHMRVEFG